jgi:hypothetical protein
MNFYDKKYHLVELEEFNGHNPLYDNVKDGVCYLAYLNPGERGWLLCEYKGTDEWMAYPHRIHTSMVKSVDCTDKQVILVTENTRFVFEVVRESGKSLDKEILKRKVCEACNKMFSDEPCEPSECLILHSIDESITHTGDV